MKKIADLKKEKEQGEYDLTHAAAYMKELEKKVFSANKASLDLMKQVRDNEIEIETLKTYIVDLKSKIAVYIPYKGDTIDYSLAEFINNYPDRNKLKVLFIRESEGVYEFGERKVGIRVDKNKINVRVGGGYLSIDEFLDQYTPIELARQERRDPLK